MSKVSEKLSFSYIFIMIFQKIGIKTLIINVFFFWYELSKLRLLVAFIVVYIGHYFSINVNTLFE